MPERQSMSDAVGFVLIGLAGAVVFVLVCWAIIPDRRTRDDANLSPDELRRRRKEAKVFQGVFRRRP
jgi:hypothetical protein